MNYSNVIKEIIVDKLGVNYSDINDNSKLVSDLGCDSLDIVEIEMEIERVCGIRIDDDYYPHDDITIGALIEGVKKLADEKC